MDERAERAWKWVLRGLGVLGFLFLIYLKVVSHQDIAVSFYVLDAGLLGLPNVISYQLKLNREGRADRADGGDNGPDPEDAYEKRHGYKP